MDNEYNVVSSHENINLIVQSSSERDNERKAFVSIPIELTSRMSPTKMKFVEGLIEHNLSVPKAAKHAGVSATYGYKLSADGDCRSLYQAMLNQRSFYSIASATEVLEKVTGILRADESEYDEILNIKTNEVKRIKPDAKARLKAAEYLLKHHKLLYDGNKGVEINNNRLIVVDIEDDDKALLEHYEQRKDITPNTIDIDIED